jgi:uncharacterized repeat protein (TIGR02543 family)
MKKRLTGICVIAVMALAGCSPPTGGGSKNAQWGLGAEDQAAVDGFKTAYSITLEKNPDAIKSLEEAEVLLREVEQALEAFYALSNPAKEALRDEWELLERLKAKAWEIIAEGADDETVYTIDYRLNGGTNNSANPASYTPKSPGITLAAPSRVDCSFGGWYSDAAFSAAVSGIPAGSTGDKIFYAKWTVNSFDQPIVLTIDNFTDPAAGALTEESFTLTRPGGTKTISINGSDNNGATALWYLGLVQIGTGSSVTLSADTLSVRTYTLRVVAEYGGAKYSKELAFTVTE